MLQGKEALDLAVLEPCKALIGDEEMCHHKQMYAKLSACQDTAVNNTCSEPCASVAGGAAALVDS